MGLDLGGLIGSLGGAYINAKYSGPQQSVPYYNPGAVGFSDFGGAINATPTLGIPFADLVRDAPGTGMLWDPGANCGNGKWIKKRRRRHRNLATRGDIRDLSALKGVIGQGKLLEAWIATHS